MHQGDFVFNEIKKSGYPISAIARKLEISRLTLYNRLKQPVLPTGLLSAISKIIRRDFSDIAPEVDGYTISCNEKLIKQQAKYSEMLEKYIQLLCFTLDIIDEVKRPALRKEIITFVKKGKREFKKTEWF